MKISARNVLKGKVKEVTKGAVNAEVKVDIGGGLVLVSVIHHEQLGGNPESESGKRGVRGHQGVQCDDRHGLTP